ncbi:hypothetical protein ABEW34_17480 [Paenibacillus algorifonticola]|uniref:hypothetical protein n=1 Tax=Paenibacillus algorifonticola TaxID=684063 RepID=UPI003D2D1960
MRREEIRKDIGTSYEKLSQLNNIGEISLDVSTKNAKSQYWIDSAIFQSYLEGQKSRISRGEAALILGVNKTSVQKIISSPSPVRSIDTFKLFSSSVVQR